MRKLWRSDYPLPPAQWTTTRFSNGCATTGFDCFEGSRQAARLFFNYSVIIFVPSRGLTQTVTQKQRGQESTGEGRMASSVPLRLFCGLHGLADDAADGVGGGALHSLRGVGVGAEGKARVIVSQRAGQRLDIHAVLEGQRGEGVSEVVKPDVFRTDGLQDLLMGVPEGVRIEHGAGLGRHE